MKTTYWVILCLVLCFGCSDLTLSSSEEQFIYSKLQESDSILYEMPGGKSWEYACWLTLFSDSSFKFGSIRYGSCWFMRNQIGSYKIVGDTLTLNREIDSSWLSVDLPEELSSTFARFQIDGQRLHNLDEDQVLLEKDFVFSPWPHNDSLVTTKP